jgi:vancomycin resistance protein YoaR
MDGSRLRAERARIFGGVVCLLIASALTGLVLASSQTPAHAAIPDVEIRIQGAAITEAEAREIAHEFATSWGEGTLTLKIGEDAIAQTRSAFGGSIDEAALAARITQARDPLSMMRRLHASAGHDTALEIPIDVRLDASATLALLLERKDHLDVRPRDARIEPRTRAVLPERDGLTLDVHGTLDVLLHAMRTGAPEAYARVLVEPARRAAAELERIELDATLGTFETRYSTLIDAAERTHNLRIAASRIDGTVLMPGETFDFNEVVGERSEANGFRPAPEIAAGELVDGIGGGTCQIAGTLHAAVYFAGLRILERSPHSRPSTYIWMGLDAVVVYPRLNLRFTNDLPFPVAIGMTVEGGVARAEIRGARQARVVSFARRIDEITPFRERIEEDPTLPLGVRVERQHGVPGFRVARYRLIRDVERNQTRRQHSEDTYPATDRVVRVGTGAPAQAGFVPPPGDSHPEYTSDEYLVASQGTNIDGMDIVRRGGRTVERGWTADHVVR